MQLITAEYSTGLIRSTLQAQPRRHLVLGAKALVAAAVGAVAGATLGAAAGATSVAILGDHLAEGRTITQMSVSSGCMLAVVGVLVVGLGAALRSAVGTLALSAVILVGSLALPDNIGRWTPGQAGAALLEGGGQFYGSGTGLALLVVWAAASLGSGMWLLERRDA